MTVRQRDSSKTSYHVRPAPGQHAPTPTQVRAVTVSPRPTLPLPANPVLRAPIADPDALVLSILVPTVPGRESKLSRLLALLDPQIAGRAVELLVLRDSRGITIGEKRTKMIAIARGMYVAFIDDDDVVAPDYVDAILSGLESQPDVLNFTVRVEGHGAPKPCRYGLMLAHADHPESYERKPNHLMVWRRELALDVAFPPVAIGEDTAWAETMALRAKTEVTIERELYTYCFDPQDNSATPR